MALRGHSTVAENFAADLLLAALAVGEHASSLVEMIEMPSPPRTFGKSANPR